MMAYTYGVYVRRKNRSLLKKIRFSPSSFLDTNNRKNSCSKEQEFFLLYSPSASYIELRSVIFASQVIFASRVLEANIIPLLPKAKISLCRKA